MKDKLTINHLAPYFPYGLKFYCKAYGGEVWIANGWQDDEILSDQILSGEEDGLGNYLFFNLNKIKPMLRPISLLIEEIEIGGEWFIPMEVIFGWSAEEEDNYYLYKKIPLGWAQCRIDKHWEYGMVQKLFEWHFDVFGLIERGLAIDINTLNKKSCQ